jgi:cell division protein FtsW (lipid II flippase)
MNAQYAYTPDIWPSLFTAIVLAALAAYGWRRRDVPSASMFALSCLFAALWAAGLLMEVAATQPETKIFWFKFWSVWQVPVVTAVTCFVIEYAWPGRWLTRRNVIILFIPSLLILVTVMTNDLHHLVWRGFTYDERIVPERTRLD